MKINNCPRCGSASIKYGRGKNKYTIRNYIRCEDCGLRITSSAEDTLVKSWNQTKEQHLDYAVRTMDLYGNAYIGEQTKEIWKNADIAAYLTSQLGRQVHIRPCTYVDNGCIAEFG